MTRKYAKLFFYLYKIREFILYKLKNINIMKQINNFKYCTNLENKSVCVKLGSKIKLSYSIIKERDSILLSYKVCFKIARNGALLSPSISKCIGRCNEFLHAKCKNNCKDIISNN